MEDFECISPDVYFRPASKYPPTTSLKSSQAATSATVEDDDPALIVMCTWMQAEKKHIDKYTEKYVQECPDANILIIRTPLRTMVFKPSDKAQQKRIGPAMEIIEQGKSSSIFFHVFSNGGTVTVSQVLLAMTDKRRALIQAIVLDSCPGLDTYRRTAHAIIASAPKNARPLFPLVVYPLLAVPALLGKLGMTNVLSRGRPRLNDKGLILAETPRLYLYSEADAMIHWKDVRDHAEEARRVGFHDVREIMFDDSRHCALTREKPEVYWGAVRDLLESAPLQAKTTTTTTTPPI